VRAGAALQRLRRGWRIGAPATSKTRARHSTQVPDSIGGVLNRLGIAVSELRPDLVGGLTGAAVVLPMAMAYATVAGLPPAVGLYTMVLPTVVYALLTSSRVLCISSTSTIAILTGAALAAAVPQADPAQRTAATATLAALVGTALVSARMLRLGFVANFISEPVLVGFRAGIGLVIVIDQLPRLLGLAPGDHTFVGDLVALARHVNEVSWPTVAVGLASLAILLGLDRIAPRAPAPLVAVAGAIAACRVLGLQAMGVSTVGAVPMGLPGLTWPDVATVRALVPGALGIALMSFTGTIAASRVFRREDDPPIDSHRELVATGVANLGGALLGAMPTGGSASQTAIVYGAGARSRNASLVMAVAAVATMLLLAPPLSLLPNATLGAVVIVYSWKLIAPREFLLIRSVRAMEFHWALVACLGVLLFGTLPGIVIAIIVSTMGLAMQTAHPRVSVIGRKPGADVLRPLTAEHPDDETVDGLLIVRPEGRLYFVNEQYVAERIAALAREHAPRVLAIDMSRVTDIEYSALRALMVRERRVTAAGIEVWFAALNPATLGVFRRSGFAAHLGEERMLYNARQVIERFRRRAADTSPDGPA
jgi:high affinity sulfate transporter 1